MAARLRTMMIPRLSSVRYAETLPLGSSRRTVSASASTATRLDAFVTCVRTEAGFDTVGHIVLAQALCFQQGASSRFSARVCLRFSTKGRPQKPARPLTDVQPWEYTGNKAHPTEKAIGVLLPLIRTFSRPGDLVLDPF